MHYLSPIDAAFLQMESPRTPMHVAGLLTFRLPDDAPPDYLHQLFAFMRSQAVTMPPFSYKLAHTRFGKLAPAWEEAADLDIDYHMRHSALPYPGGERELGVLVARLHSYPMDLRRPPWECHLIEGLENRRFAFYLKSHHAALDGMGALRLIRNWLSPDPAYANAAGPWALPPAEVPPPPEQPPVTRSALRHFAAVAREQARSAAELGRALYRMSKPADNPEGGLLTNAMATPRSVFNVPVTAQRRLATQLFDLNRFKALSKATGATINDLSLAICGGGIRRYLLELDALPELPLIASIPVGLARSEGKAGNAVAGFVCPMGTHEADVKKRLEIISAITSRTKEQLKTLSPGALQKFTMLGLSPLILGQMAHVLARLPPFFNVVVSNVIGSKEKLYFRGAELESMHPISVLFDGYALNITIVGYADKLSLGFTGCRDALPRLQRLAVYTGEALAELEQVYGLRKAPRRRTAKKKA